MTSDSDSNNFSLDVVGIGNAIVDVIVKIEDSFLKEHSLKKGNMMLINEEEAKKLYQEIGPGIESSGGSAANTIAGIAQLGGKAGFIGRVKNDQLGEIFIHDINSVGALFKTPASQKGPSTARCMIFVTPDAQRTMCTYLGASVMLDPQDIDTDLVRQAKVLYLEGYLWDDDIAKSAFLKAARAARESRSKIALSLSDAFCVERHRDSFIELIHDYVDIVFANESEVNALYQTSSLDKAIKGISKAAEISVITCGENGSKIITGNEKMDINAYKFSKAIDTTGAGDLYAGGFLYGFTSNKDLRTCGELGSICAGEIVTQVGPRSQKKLKEIIRPYL